MKRKKNFLGTQAETRLEMNLMFGLLFVFLLYVTIVCVAIGCPIVLVINRTFAWGLYGHYVWIVTKFGFAIILVLMVILNICYTIWERMNKE